MRGWNALGWTVIVSIALVLGCGSPSGQQDPTSDAQAVELHAYAVPEGFDAQQLRDYLANALRRGDTTVGSVVKLPDGTLVVTAPPGIHAGLRQMLADLEKRGPQAERNEAETMAIRYWFLIARPASGAGERVRIASALLREAGALRPVLDELASAQGPLEFALLEQLYLTSLDGGVASRIRGRQFEVEQRVLNNGGSGPIASLTIRSFGSQGITHSLETTVRLDTAQFVVLGQTAYRAGALPEGWSASDDVLLYYVISNEAA